MKANELRIGNWVFNETIGKAMQVYPMMIHQLSKIDGNEHNVKPIPLTEEWSLKFKWQLVKGNDYYLNSYFHIDKDGRLYYRNDYTGINIKHVHQLQNLYFALIGEELQIKQKEQLKDK